MSLQLGSRRDALIWIAIDKIFCGADARNVCAELELDLLREQAERHLTRSDQLLRLLRDTGTALTNGSRPPFPGEERWTETILASRLGGREAAA
jgi:hypothetical protein